MSPQAKIWLLTIPKENFTPHLPESAVYIRGQAEVGAETGYQHWQVLVFFHNAKRLRHVKSVFGRECHAEPSKSAAADQYVWKDDTAVPDTRFEFGKKPVRRNSRRDWDLVRSLASSGDYGEIPSDIIVRYYANLKRITADNLKPVAIVREVNVFWGDTGTGKSRTAWEQAGLNAYPKDPNTKFWDGYNGQDHVVIDEFRGRIDISHMLRWLDRYPVTVEIKGSATVLKASKIWITSNLNPRDWYKDLDSKTVEALLRRLKIVHFLSFPQ